MRDGRETGAATRDERLVAARASLALARQAFVRPHAPVDAGVTPAPAAFGEVVARLDEAVREPEAAEGAGPFPAPPGGRGCLRRARSPPCARPWGGAARISRRSRADECAALGREVSGPARARPTAQACRTGCRR
jgi:hypothetical protein